MNKTIVIVKENCTNIPMKPNRGLRNGTKSMEIDSGKRCNAHKWKKERLLFNIWKNWISTSLNTQNSFKWVKSVLKSERHNFKTFRKICGRIIL